MKDALLRGITAATDGGYIVDVPVLLTAHKLTDCKICRAVLRSLFSRYVAEAELPDTLRVCRGWCDFAPGQTYGELAVEILIFGAYFGYSPKRLLWYQSLGANLNGIYHEGGSLLVLAIEQSKWRIASDLMELGVRNETPPSYETKWLTHPQTLLHRLADHYTSNRRALCRVAEKWLSLSGCNVNACDGEGNTPLHLACQHANTPMVRLLLKHGANPYCANAEGESPALRRIWKQRITNPHVC